ncbi:hypothetical protein [Hymenobacter fodinae]|uniref:S1 motif domain-containing protein n=1 Tax=Hymenobacter fodinae TaxID=2510796 RepID=A0A4Z0P7Q7_9BACT|nr:hypothetical protein [Hymenobacter fodinae]TGE07965.1 hypothetical protein EU556_09470 [Hymenobacter fodinae]
MTSQLAREQLAQAYPPGTPVKGKILTTLYFGVFVQLDGFPSDVSALLEIIHVPNLDYQQYPNGFPIEARIEARVMGWTKNFGQVYLTQYDRHSDNPLYQDQPIG